MTGTFAWIGLFLIVAAIVGGRVKWGAYEVPEIRRGASIALFVIGVVLIISHNWDTIQSLVSAPGNDPPQAEPNTAVPETRDAGPIAPEPVTEDPVLEALAGLRDSARLIACGFSETTLGTFFCPPYYAVALPEGCEDELNRLLTERLKGYAHSAARSRWRVTLNGVALDICFVASDGGLIVEQRKVRAESDLATTYYNMRPGDCFISVPDQPGDAEFVECSDQSASIYVGYLGADSPNDCRDLVSSLTENPKDAPGYVVRVLRTSATQVDAIAQSEVKVPHCGAPTNVFEWTDRDTLIVR